MLWVWMLSPVGTEVLLWKSEEVWEQTAWSEDPLGHMGETISPFGVHLKEVALSFWEQKSWWAPLHPPQSIGTETLPRVTNLDACYLLYFTTHSMPLCLGGKTLPQTTNMSPWHARSLMFRGLMPGIEHRGHSAAWWVAVQIGWREGSQGHLRYIKGEFSLFWKCSLIAVVGNPFSMDGGWCWCFSPPLPLTN